MPLPKDFTFKVTNKQYPLWKGPEDTSENGGISFSMITGWLCDRERFRIKYMVGLQPAEKFNVRLEYGNMWHVCEEHIDGDWKEKLQQYAIYLRNKYPLQDEDITHWYNVCARQFPFYKVFWEEHPDIVVRQPLLNEVVFKVPYKLPSGRTVYIRGKKDGVDLVNGGIWLQENKTKGDIQPVEVEQQLSCDLQTMLYLIALQKFDWLGEPPGKIAGVRYNVVRRPLSGGKGSIRRHQPTKSNPNGESWESFYSRLEEYFVAEPEYYFMRWNIGITEKDINNFKLKYLDSMLEQLCYWYNCVSKCKDPYRCVHRVHWVHPRGANNFINDGGSTPYDDYISNGDELGLKYTGKLFPELQ